MQLLHLLNFNTTVNYQINLIGLELGCQIIFKLSITTKCTNNLLKYIISCTYKQFLKSQKATSQKRYFEHNVKIKIYWSSQNDWI